MERRSHPPVVWWAVAILFAGLLSAEIIYFLADKDEEAAVVAGMAHTKVYRHDMELVGGKAAVLAGGVADWFAGLWHGRALAYVVAVVSAVVAGVCFVIGWLQTPRRGD